jgi:hypothetical protein
LLAVLALAFAVAGATAMSRRLRRLRERRVLQPEHVGDGVEETVRSLPDAGLATSCEDIQRAFD